MTKGQMASMIDHTLLAAHATPAEVERLCAEAVEWRFAAVCVNPLFVPLCAKLLTGSPVRVAAVVGFPLGAAPTELKAAETRWSLERGATEIDMVIPIGLLIAGESRAVRDDIAALAGVVHRHGRGGLLKVILETAALTPEQIVVGCRCAAEGEADYVKTSTGFHPAGGATVEAVRLLHRHASPIKVKASGGIRDREAALRMAEAGASRIGTSSGVAIMKAWDRAS